MAHFGDGVEQALHYLFQLGGPDNGGLHGREPDGTQPDNHASPMPSARDVADFYGLSSSGAAKLFTKLEKAGIVRASEGREGGFRLARPLAEIRVLDVADAIEGPKRLFECKEIRANCAVFQGEPPDWATSGVCAIHAAMLEAERAMRKALAGISLADIKHRASNYIPEDFGKSGDDWFSVRRLDRRKTGGRATPMKPTTKEKP